MAAWHVDDEEGEECWRGGGMMQGGCHRRGAARCEREAAQHWCGVRRYATAYPLDAFPINLDQIALLPSSSSFLPFTFLLARRRRWSSRSSGDSGATSSGGASGSSEGGGASYGARQQGQRREQHGAVNLLVSGAVLPRGACSFHVALALVADGAPGETRCELLGFLGSPSLAELHRASVT
uniref:Uncharacterized protein n=1 Tax=Oryza glumipatula TaxID=40148 RepID=A0A0E0B088_9ORYZ